jgi:transcriptional regulator with XRE-family HTH domain
MELHEKIKVFMTANGISQKELAKALGKKESSMSLRLNGKRKITADELCEIIKFFGLSDAETFEFLFS